MPINTRARILEAALKLLDAEGIRGATVDGIATEASITKRTLYYHFRSKDDLVAQALAVQSIGGLGSLGRIIRGSGDHLETSIMKLFAEVAAYATDPKWKGCAFIRASLELAGLPGHPAVGVAREYRKCVEKTFNRELAEIAIDQPAHLARRLAILLDGAIVLSVVHRDPSYATEAGRVAVSLIKAARTITPVTENKNGESSSCPTFISLESEEGGRVLNPSLG